MKKILLSMLLAASAVNVFAQKESTVLSVTYQTTFQRFEEDDSVSKDLSRLDIGVRSSQFISVVSEWFMKNREQLAAKEQRIKSPYVGYSIFMNTAYKNMPEQGIVSVIHMPGWVTVQDSVANLFEWNLVEGDSTICNYPDGPWRFGGLPGLILSAKESEGIFSFNAIGIENGDGHSFEFPAYKNKKVVTPKRAEELCILEGEDNDAYMSLMTGFQMKTTAAYDANGNPVPIVPKHAVLIERTPKKPKKK